MRRRTLLYAVLLLLAAPVASALLPGLRSGEQSANAGAGREQAPLRLRVLSYNIHHGEGTDEVFDLPRLAEVIRDARPDLVALQEVDRETRRASGLDQAAELGRLTGMHPVFGQAMPYSGGDYGEAVLSRFPLLETKNHALPYQEGFEPRTALAVRIHPWPDGPDVVFVATHLDHTREHTNRMMQARTINEIMRDEGETPLILAGDLNGIPGSPPIRELLRSWTDAAAVHANLEGGDPAPTFPSAGPDRRIDFIMFQPEGGWRVVEVEVLAEEVASDHRPLLVVLEYLASDSRRP